MSEPKPQPIFAPPVSTFTGPVAELIAQRMLLPPPRPGLLALLDHYEILRVVGAGGMGVVLLARDLDTGREVALKLVRSDLVTNQHVVHRFLKEAGHLKRLRHSNIVPVLALSERPECPYFVMPYFEHGSLASRIKPGQPLDTETILNIALQLAEGLSFAHRSGIIHRDLKPANLLLGGNGQVCLADFGLARTVFNDTIVDVESRQYEGTVPYMSPALAAGDAEDTRCDIYSFGALLYEMLTGLPPYQGRGPKEILDQILAGPPKPITSQQAGADRGLVAVAEKAMARELRNRYADMRDVLKDLQLIKGGKAPLAQSRAHPMAPTAKLALALAAMALLALLTWFFWPRNLHQTAPLPAVVSSPSSPLPTSPQPVVTPAPVSPKPIVPEQRETTPHSQPPVAPSPLVPQPISPPPAPMPQPTPEPALTVALWATGNSCLGQPGVGGDADGVGDQVRFRLPNSVAVDRGGNVYVADTGNSVIRKIATDGTVTTLAGAGGITGSADGFGNRARFRAPFGIAVDTVGNVYVADTINNTIRKITTDGYVHTVAGLAGNPGSSFGLGSGARFRNPWGLAADEEGNVWVADTGNDVIRKITPAGQVITVAGEAGMSGHADGFGPLARFHAPFAVVADQRGHIYVADTGNHTIRRIAQGGEVVTVAGLPGQAGYADGSGSAARFSSPQGLAVDDSGNLYVADAGNNLIRKVSPAGWVTTLPAFANPSVSTGSTSSSLRLQAPGGVAVSARGILYVADTAQDCILKQFIPTP